MTIWLFFSSFYWDWSSGALSHQKHPTENWKYGMVILRKGKEDSKSHKT